MKTKKIISIIAASVIALSVLSGCGKTAEPTVETKAPAATVETKTTEPVAETKTPEIYTASAKDFDKIGWKAALTVTYVDDKITKVEYDEVNKDGKKKSEDEGYAKQMKDATKLTPVEVFTKLTDTALKEDKVDVVTGATSTSNGFKELYEQAKAMKK